MTDEVLRLLVSVIAGGVITQSGNVLVARIRASKPKPSHYTGNGVQAAIDRHQANCQWGAVMRSESTRWMDAVQTLREDIRELREALNRHRESHE